MIAAIRDRLMTSFELARAAVATVRHHPRLLVFPALTAAAALPLLASFAAPVWLLRVGDGSSIPRPLQWLMDAPTSVLPLVFGFLIAQMFITLYVLYATVSFFNVALTHATLAALRGEEPKVADALRHAASRLRAILAYAAIAFGVGWLLGTLQERLKVFSRILPFTLGLAWTAVALLVLPVLVQERRGARDAIRRAAELLKRSWGEGTIAGIALWVLWLPLVAVGLLFGRLGLTGFMRIDLTTALALLAATVALSLGTALAQDFLNTVYGAALYVFAAEGVVPGGFDALESTAVFRVRGSRDTVFPRLRPLPDAVEGRPRRPSRIFGYGAAALVVAALALGARDLARGVTGWRSLLRPAPGVALDTRSFRPALRLLWETELGSDVPVGVTALAARERSIVAVTGHTVFRLDGRGVVGTQFRHGLGRVDKAALAARGSGLAIVLVGGWPNSVAAYDGEGKPLWTFPAGSNTLIHGIAPLRAPGRADDLVAVAYAGGSPGVCLLDGDGRRLGCDDGFAMRWFAISLDCDWDGIEEAVATSPASHPYFGSKLGCYSAAGRHVTDLHVPKDPFAAATTDFDGDGRTDIVAWYPDGPGGPYVLAGWSTKGQVLREVRLDAPKESILASVAAGRLAPSRPGEAIAALSDGWIVGFSRDGEPWGQRILAGDRVLLATADLDGDGVEELVTASDGVVSAWKWDEGVTAVEPGVLARQDAETGTRALEEGWVTGDLAQLRRARARFGRAIAMDPGVAEAYAGLAAAELALSRGGKGSAELAGARRRLTEGREKGGRGPAFERVEAFLKHREGDDVAATGIMERVSRDAPETVGPWLDLARYEARQYRLNKASAALQAALRRATSAEETFLVHMQAGAVHEQVQAWADAASAYERAVSARSDRGAAWARLAVSLLEEKRCSEARQAARRAVDLGRTWDAGWVGVRAEACLGQLDGESPFLRAASPRGLVAVADFFRDRGDLEKAGSYYAQVEAGTAEPELTLSRSELALRSGDTAAALALVEPLSARLPEDGAVLAQQARVRLRSGEKAQALDLAARALEADGGRVTRERLRATFGPDPDFRALERKASARTEGLFQYVEERYDYQRLRRDETTTRWILATLGAHQKDRGGVPFILPYLAESPVAETRAGAADALWYIGDRRAVPGMIAALEDPSLKVRGFAASGLGDMADPSAVDPLLALFGRLADNREETKARVADALGKLRDARAAPAIEESLRTLRDPAYVRWATPALARLKKAEQE